MKRLLGDLLVLVLVLLPFKVQADGREAYVLQGATKAYIYNDVFLGGALLYRPEGTERLDVIDLSKAKVFVIARPAPLNCMQLVITSEDGLIFGGCVKEATVNLNK